MSERVHHSSGTAFEAAYGYDRAVRVGDQVAVAGTLGLNPDGSMPEGAYAQSVAALERIASALEAVGASTADVIRTRMYVVDIEANFEAVGRAHAEAFGDVRPVTSMIGIAALIAPGFVVEIEADAVISARC